MKRRRPFTLPLHGYEVRVRWVRGLAESAGADGQWTESERLIELDADLEDSEAVEALLHECCHAITDLAGIRLSERVVRVMGLGLHQMVGGAVDLRRLR